MAIHPQGDFRASILNHGFKKGNNGQEFWIHFATAEGTIYAFLYLTRAAAEHSIKKIRAAGFQGDDLGDLEDGTALRDNECDIVIDHEEWKGKMRAKVSWINEVGGGFVPDRDPGVAQEAAREWNEVLRATDKSSYPSKSNGNDHGDNRSQQREDHRGYAEEPPPAEDHGRPNDGGDGQNYPF